MVLSVSQSNTSVFSLSCCWLNISVFIQAKAFFFLQHINTAGLSLFWLKQLVWFLWSHLSKSRWSDAKLYACYWKIFCLVACKYLSVTCLFSIHWLLLSSLVFMSVDINCKGEFLFHIFQISLFFFYQFFCDLCLIQNECQHLRERVAFVNFVCW